MSRENLGYYEDLKSEDLTVHDVALVHLKQHWLETVEQRHRHLSILQLNSRFPDHQLLSRFLGDKAAAGLADKPDWVEHTLSQREDEFNRWLKQSGDRLRKTVEVQRSQLRHQLDLLRANTRWLSPYLQETGQHSAADLPGLVKGFNTSHLRLVLLVEGSTLLEQRVETGELPVFLGHRKLRSYCPVTVIELEFRATGRPGKGLRGRVEVRLTGYGLSGQELEVVRRELQRAELHQTIVSLEASALETCDRVVALVEPELNLETLGMARPPSDTNPFAALFSFFRSAWQRLFGQPSNLLQHPDSYLEKVKRTVAVVDAAEKCQSLFHQLKRLSP